MPNWKKIVTSGSDATLNSLSVTNGITGSLLGTATTASSVTPLNQNVRVTGSINILSTFATTGNPLEVKNSGYFNAYFQGTTANNQASFYLDNDRGGFASYGGFLYGGSTSNLGNIFGVSRADKLMMFADGANNLGFYVGTITSQPFVIGTNNSEQIRITGAGNVGIGTSTPNAKLHVSGNVQITGSAANALLVRASGSTTIATFQGSDGLYRAFFGNTQHVINVTNNGTLSIRPNEGTTNNPGFDFVTGTFGNLSYIEFAGLRYRIGHTGANNANAGLLFQIRNALTSLSTPRFSFDVNSTSITTTSGTSTGISYTDTFAAGAGSASYRPLNLAYTINNSGAQTGTATGIFLNATETALNSMTHNLMDLQTGGVSRFRMTNAGATRIAVTSNVATAGSTLTVIGSGSAQPIFTVQGSQGELFSVTDSLSGSLFSVNDISGLPIMEVFSDNTILMGDYQDPMMLTTKKIVQTNSGSFVAYSIPTSSYDGAFIDYVIKSGSNARAGTIMSTWVGSSIEFTEVDTMDIGSTTAVGLTMILSGSNAVLTGSSSTGTWTIRTIIRTI